MEKKQKEFGVEESAGGEKAGRVKTEMGKSESRKLKRKKWSQGKEDYFL